MNQTTPTALHAHPLRIIDIGKTIAARHQVPLALIRSKDSRHRIVAARHAYWVALVDAGLSYSRCGQVTGGHHHTTVLYGVQKLRAAA
jgi:chromosomal replication initiation ATPase DnaA